MQKIIIAIFFVLMPVIAYCQYQVSGVITDFQNSNSIPNATIINVNTKKGVISDINGKYIFNLPKGKHKLYVSYTGYETLFLNFSLTADTIINLKLNFSQKQLDAVVISAKRENERITNDITGMASLSIEEIKNIPAFLGEIDVIKAMQLLPGVTSASEGSSGISIRGGSPDQNLILMDGAKIYNASHAMGFFPLFNYDALDNVTLYKGDIPIDQGGRLSSMIDIEMKDGDKQKYNVVGGIGLLSARLTVDGPIIKDKMSFLVSGRRSWFDLFLPLAKDEFIKDTRMYFWDLSGKISYDINKKNRISISSYAGNDVADIGAAGMRATYGNRLVSFNWIHNFNEKWYSKLSANYVKYIVGMGIESGDIEINMDANIQDMGLKYDVSYLPNKNHHIEFGYQSSFYIFEPGDMEQIIKSSDSEMVVDSTGEFVNLSTKMTLPRMYGLENALYIGNTQKVGKHLSLRYGLRASSFSNIGPDKVYTFNDNYYVTDTNTYGKGDFYHTSWALEPRIGVNVIINNANSIKFNYSRTAQYVQLAQNTAAGLPQDRWFPSNPNIKPQIADMFALGYFRNWADNEWETSIEVYYKILHNVIDFKDHASLMVNDLMYGDLRTGKGWATGGEILIKRTKGIVTGWVSYTLSRSMRTIEGINDGRPYLSPFDRTHNFAITLNYNITKRLQLGATWVYYTGTPYTVPVGKAEVEGTIIPVYSDRNAFRMPDYHRLDIGLTIRPKEKPTRKWDYDFNISIYNVYNRANAWTIAFKNDPDNPNETYAEMSYLFGLIPSFTFNFRF